MEGRVRCGCGMLVGIEAWAFVVDLPYCIRGYS